MNSVKLAFANPSWSWGPALGDSPGPLSCPSDGHIRELQAPPGRSVEGRDQVLKKKINFNFSTVQVILSHFSLASNQSTNV